MNRLHVARSLPLALIAVLGACAEARDATADQGASVPDAPPSGWPVAVERARAAPPEYERVVLVTIDTLRADHVSCYGYPRRTTPFLDSLAARGVRFARTMAAVSHTAPSHATMLTGLVPAVHGVLQNGDELDPAATDLAELFGAAGFESAAFLNVRFLSGVAASFDKVEVRATGRDRRPLDGAAVIDASLAWLERERKGARFFLWVHLYDPHKWKERITEHEGRPEPLWSGATPPDFLARLTELHGLPAPEPGVPYVVDWSAEKKSGEVLDVRGVDEFMKCIDAYDELTLFADRQVERLYAGIEALALPGRTLWVVTADHGEGLASHGVAGHGGRIYQEQLHVPLVLHAADGSLAPRVVDELVAHVDLLPTLAETLGGRVSAHPRLYDGRSLWPLVRGESAWPARPVFAQRRPAEDANDPDQAEIYALQDARYKLILHEPGADEFFDLARDPRELHDLGAGHASAAELHALLEERLQLYAGLARAGGDADVPEEWLQELRDLGYVR